MIKLFGQVDLITGDEKLPVCRDGPVYYKDGKPEKGPSLKFEIICNVQPLLGKELQLVPEGDRFRENLWVFTNQMQKQLLVNDIISRCGIKYQCQSAENWGSFTKARIVRLDVGPNAA